MKKSVIVLWCLAALFLVSSFTLLPNVGPFAVGLVVASVLGYIGYLKHVKSKREEEEKKKKEAEIAEKRRVYNETYGDIMLAVSGVTFENRQLVLATLYNESFGDPIEGALEESTYEGKPAVQVYAEGEMIGYVRKTDLPQVLPIVSRIENVSIYIEHFEDSGRKIYRADASVKYRK